MLSGAQQGHPYGVNLTRDCKLALSFLTGVLALNHYESIFSMTGIREDSAAHPSAWAAPVQATRSGQLGNDESRPQP